MPILVMVIAITLLLVAALIIGRCDIDQTMRRHRQDRPPHSEPEPAPDQSSDNNQPAPKEKNSS